MRKIDFNEGWEYRRTGETEWKSVTLPHDAMILEERRADCAGGENTGWFEGRDYEYKKTFFLPQEYEKKDIAFLFEGVYRKAEVYVNGKLTAYRPYGDSDIRVEPCSFLRFNAENEIRVTAKNSDQPNSRWYSGAGIYRPVSLLIAPSKRVAWNGIKIRTLSLSPAVLEIRVGTVGEGEVRVEIEKDGKTVSSCAGYSDGRAELVLTATVENAKLWSVETPELYRCRVTFGEDEREETFGIRKTECTREKGFCVNGERVILRGACIHHDNGILGARCYPEAEERKIRLLKENGYNAVRSAHNPCSRALLDACDRLGMLVLDEYVDVWYIHKTRYDYADYAKTWYEPDIADMIAKDYNHPSVIMYSLGNEVAETGEEEGIEFFIRMRDLCHRLDPDRPVTAGVNIFFNYLYSLGFGVYSEKKAKERPKKKVGSEFFNALAGLFGAGVMKTMARLPGCDKKTRGCFAEMDVAGYNYGIERYKKDLKKYPDRIILGTETFCADACAFWDMAQKETGIIGDFVWAGTDYLGEVGVGAWEYKDYAPTFARKAGWLTAGSGRIDLIGTPLGEALYTRVAFGLEEKPQIAVVPVNHTNDPHSPSAWKFSNALPSWSWEGCEGKKAVVEVYSRAPMVRLYLNGRKVGEKKRGKNCRYRFAVRYEAGELCAVACDGEGKEIARHSLFSAGEQTVLSVVPEKARVKAGEVCFIRLCYTDEKGEKKPLIRGELRVSVEGGELLALGNACPFNARGYHTDRTDTYYGEALAIVKAKDGEKVTLSAFDGERKGEASLSVYAPCDA